MALTIELARFRTHDGVEAQLVAELVEVVSAWQNVPAS
jgi:hypothetical protein